MRDLTALRGRDSHSGFILRRIGIALILIFLSRPFLAATQGGPIPVPLPGHLQELRNIVM